MPSNYDNCPKCSTSFFGDPIPKDIREHYSPPYYWRRELGIEILGRYDGISEWKCPDCGYRWDAFTGKEVKGEED